MFFCQGSSYALDEHYDWASGYKFRTTESMDYIDYFKHRRIEGGGFYQYIPDLWAEWDVHQGNWNATFPACRTWTPPTCTAAGVFTTPIEFTYTCLGDVSYPLEINQNAEPLVGGDTMYGAWSMLFNYFPPVLDEKDCSQFGRCFVGNAFILDTKAQKEEIPGRLWALGIKELVESPGDVFFFDQVRAMTQPPKDTAREYNNPYLVGDAVVGLPPPGPSGVCDGALFEEQLGSMNVPAEVQAAFDSEVRPKLEQYPELLEAYAAGQAATGTIPCEILAGIHYNEGANNPNTPIWDPARGFQGGTLESDAVFAANRLQQQIDGLFGSCTQPNGVDYDNNLEGYIAGVTLHNGCGNLNCNPDRYDCYPGPYYPTRWRVGGKCPPQYEYEDSEYALAWMDDRHMDMDIIFKYDFNASNPCAAFGTPVTAPLPKQGPGVIPMAFAVHNWIMGN